MSTYLTQAEMLEKIERLEKSLEQSKAANKRIKADCRYIDYKKLQGRFFSKCTEVERLRKAIDSAISLLPDGENRLANRHLCEAIEVDEDIYGFFSGGDE